MAPGRAATSLAQCSAADVRLLLAAVRGLDASSPEALAQGFVSAIYARFAGSLVLLRFFATVPFRELAGADRALVEAKAEEARATADLRAGTPILTLLGTRGRAPEWNDRARSRRFRCIPLLSGAYVASLPMLSLQMRCMGFPAELAAGWEGALATADRRARRGVLYVRDAGVDRDDQGRFVVPARAFVEQCGVKTVFGLGCGCARHAALLTLFGFADEVVAREAVEPLAELLLELERRWEPPLGVGR